jgi:hypothetical protein
MNTVTDAAFLAGKAFRIPPTMKAWVLGDPDQLSFVDKPAPQPGPAERPGAHRRHRRCARPTWRSSTGARRP